MLFNEWYNSLRFSAEMHANFDNAVCDLLSNKIDVSQYKKNTFSLLHMNVNTVEKDENNKYYIEHILPRVDNDITTGFVAYPFYGSENSASDIKVGLNI